MDLNSGNFNHDRRIEEEIQDRNLKPATTIPPLESYFSFIWRNDRMTVTAGGATLNNL
jgi:hypothetical protein